MVETTRFKLPTMNGPIAWVTPFVYLKRRGVSVDCTVLQCGLMEGELLLYRARRFLDLLDFNFKI